MNDAPTLAGRIRPCNHPYCRDGSDGEPTLTTLGMCEPCQDRYRNAYQNLVRDYWRLRHTIPQPVRSGGESERRSKTYSHPAEWAADQTSQIARIFRDAELDARVYLGEEKPLRVMTETARVTQATRYLDPRFDALCRMDHATVTAKVIIRKHSEIKTAQGFSDRPQWSEWPCPYCNAFTLLHDEVGDIRCHSCQRKWAESSMGLLRRHSFAALLASRTRSNP